MRFRKDPDTCGRGLNASTFHLIYRIFQNNCAPFCVATVGEL